MSASSNQNSIDAATNQGEFHSRVHASEPLDGPKHKAGVQVGNDSIPESHVEMYPPGTAPANRSFRPNPDPESMGFQDPNRDPLEQGDIAFTSLDADRGIGAPMGGMSSEERHHDGQHHRKRDHTGLSGLKDDFDPSAEMDERNLRK